MTPDLFPTYRGNMHYLCLGCGKEHGIDALLYTCPDCGAVLLLQDARFDELKRHSGQAWRQVFDARAASKRRSLRGIFRFYELMAPMLEEEDILYLGEGATPLVDASPALSRRVGARFAYKNDGQNPSASFKDRGMACAFSYLKHMIRLHHWDNVLTICASTGDTSASAALYAAYMGDPVKSAVLLPQGKVTAQQLAQPLGSGAAVLELPGVFDDCMKVVERLAENYRVALLNSKNSWRILGQESYAYELAQWLDWDTSRLAVFVPIGNAGNITAIMSGFLKLFALDVIPSLPRIFGVQSAHADPVYQYYAEPDPAKRRYAPAAVRPSVAQAAMIGNPVSFPRVQTLAARYQALAGADAFQVVQVSEQAIMDAMLEANSHGHIACTQGGESLAGLKEAVSRKLLADDAFSVLDATAHAIKFMDFQQLYFRNAFPPEFDVQPDPHLANTPRLLLTQEQKCALTEQEFIRSAAEAVAARLGLKAR